MSEKISSEERMLLDLLRLNNIDAATIFSAVVEGIESAKKEEAK
mgnify:CR=1 FL=1